jgi:hypothetical protein
MVAVTSELIAWYFRYDGHRLDTLADTARRRALMNDAFATVLDSAEALDLVHEFGPRLERAAQSNEERKYYASTAQPGWPRLREHLEESAFWSKHLFRESYKRAIRLQLFLLFCPSMAVALALGLLAADQAITLAHWVAIFVSFLPVVDQWDRTLAYRKAAWESEILDHRLQRNDLSSAEPLVSAFGDYVATAVAAPTVPLAVYRANRNRLARLWEERKKNHAASTD